MAACPGRPVPGGRALAATACLTLAACGGGTASGSSPRRADGPGRAGLSSAQVSAAHLRITVTTTSDWTQLRLADGTIEAQRLRGSHGGRWSVQPFGIAMSHGSGRATVTDDLVFSDPHGHPRLRWTLEKGYDGTTRVSVVNLNSGRATRPATYTDTVHSRSDPDNTRRISLSRTTVMSRHRLALPRADSRHLVLADFYPWWAKASDYDNPKLADRPSDPRSTTTLAGVESMTAQAKAHGVDGFVVSWDGQSGHGKQFAVAQQAAADHHQVVTGYLETLEAEQTEHPAATELAWLAQLLRHASGGAFLRAGGVPVVFVYQMAALPPAQWRHIVATLNSRYGERVRLVGDATDPRYLPYEWGLHSYTATAKPAQLEQYAEATSAQAKGPAVVDRRVAPRAFVGTVSPGFDDRRLRGNTHRVVGRDQGKRYLATWRAALAGQPDWILVTSWNEWFEDTQIEPGVHTGGRALAQTAQQAARF